MFLDLIFARLIALVLTAIFSAGCLSRGKCEIHVRIILFLRPAAPGRNWLRPAGTNSLRWRRRMNFKRLRENMVDYQIAARGIGISPLGLTENGLWNRRHTAGCAGHLA